MTLQRKVIEQDTLLVYPFFVMVKKLMFILRLQFVEKKGKLYFQLFYFRLFIDRSIKKKKTKNKKKQYFAFLNIFEDK